MEKQIIKLTTKQKLLNKDLPKQIKNYENAKKILRSDLFTELNRTTSEFKYFTFTRTDMETHRLVDCTLDIVRLMDYHFKLAKGNYAMCVLEKAELVNTDFIVQSLRNIKTDMEKHIKLAYIRNIAKDIMLVNHLDELNIDDVMDEMRQLDIIK